ncbi:MAG: SAM-dependent methyltransferase [Pyrinomonadaceae bacterium]
MPAATMSAISLKIKLYLATIERINNSRPWLDALGKGFWLGVLSREDLQAIDRIYYQQTPNYCDETYNKSGFLDWERKAFLKFFQSCQTVLVAAVGGGRECFALSSLGLDVDGFECNQQLLDCARNLFAQEKIEGEFHLTEPDAVWHFDEIYDGAIVGWSAYMLIQTREFRIDFLRGMRAQLSEGAPILVSFFAGRSDELYFKRIHSMANILRRLLGRDKTELGDDLRPLSFAHWFLEIEIQMEFAEAGFKVAYYNGEVYGHAVGLAV